MAKAHLHPGVELVGKQLRDHLIEDCACIVEDFLFVRSVWNLETSVLEGDLDSITFFLMTNQFNSYPGLSRRLLRYTNDLATLDLVLRLYPPLSADIHLSVMFYALHGRPTLLRVLLLTFAGIDQQLLEYVRAEVRIQISRDSRRFPVYGIPVTPNGWSQNHDTGGFAPVFNAKFHAHRAMCLTLLNDCIRYLITGVNSFAARSVFSIIAIAGC